MMKIFKIMTTDELINYCSSLKWTRKPKELHVHHTYAPSHKNFNGKNHQELQNGMRNYHIDTNGWRDIGQHLTLMPDGLWVFGRDFNDDPASISGRNHLGFAIEMLGNFDKGHDKLEGKQLDSMLKFSKFFIEFFKLDFDKNIIFHNQYANKSCPGSSLDRAFFITQVKNYGVDEEVKIEKTIILEKTSGKKLEGIIVDGVSYLQITEMRKLGKEVVWNAKEKIVEIKL